MAIRDHLTTWQGYTVRDWAPAVEPQLTPGVLYRLAVESYSGESFDDKFAQFLAEPGVEDVTGLVLGLWADETDGLDGLIEAIAGARGTLSGLTMLFIGDITFEEWEISWIAQSDLSPLFTAYPRLEHLGVRGSQDLSLGIPKLPHLKSLTIETGGLPVSVIEEVIAAELPSLEHLELYLGIENYGGDSSVADLQPILDLGPAKWPNLTYLGLRDAPYADAIAEALATSGGAPILRQLRVLDLSLGTLGDAGVQALSACPAIAGLDRLDIHHHYASGESVALLAALGITVDASDAQGVEPEDDRYVAVSE